MNWEEIKNMESTYLDYKEKVELKKSVSWLKSVVAYANTKGGHIVFGIRDSDHNFVGLDDLQASSEQITNLISTRVEPRPRYSLTQISNRENSKFGIDLEVASGPNYPYYYINSQTKQIYLRHGERSEKATSLEQNNLLLKGINKTFDSLPTDYKLSDVSFTLLGATFKKETGENFDFARDLVSMKFITENGVVTNAGLLLCDQGYLPQSKIICTRWKGNVKGSVEEDALDDEEFKDSSLITLLSNAEAFIRTNSKNPWSVRGMRREENSDYPFRAVREVLVNALIHRDYQIQGSEVHVDIYDNRMEIVSPGGMINGSRIQDLNLKHVPSIRRNEIISDIFGRLRYMDRRGSGIQRILNSYVNFIEQPEFYSDNTVFVVTLPNRSESTLVQTQLQGEKTQLQGEKTQLQGEKTQLQGEKTQLQDEKTQLQGEKTQLQKYDKLYLEKLNQLFRKNTASKLIELFHKYGFKYQFNREIVANHLDISLNYASQVIKRCKESKVIKMKKRGAYYFNDKL